MFDWWNHTMHWGDWIVAYTVVNFIIGFARGTFNSRR